MESNYYLVLDQGGSSSRAIVFDEKGGHLAEAQQAISSQRPGPGRVEQLPGQLVASLKQVAAEAIGQLSAEQRLKVRSAGLVCQRSSLLCWDKRDGQPLSPVLSWQDTRAGEYLDRIVLDREPIYRKTGLVPNAHYGASKMHWCLQHLPAVATAAEQGTLRMAPLASYLINTLLEEAPYRVDPANASRTLLFNLETANWDEELLVLFGLQSRHLPAVSRSIDDFGTLVCEGCRIPLRLLSGDQSAAAFALGRPSKGVATVNMGTGAFVLVPVATPDFETGLLNSIVHWDTHPEFVLEGTVNGAGAALQWYAEITGEKKLVPALKRAVASAGAPPLFLNGVGGLGSPDWRATFATEFIGDGDRDEKMLAIMESIIFLLQRNLASMAKAEPLSAIVISGGLSREDYFCQLLADLSCLPVRRAMDTEATARGAAFILSGFSPQWQVAGFEVFESVKNPGLDARYRQWTEQMSLALAR